MHRGRSVHQTEMNRDILLFGCIRSRMSVTKIITLQGCVQSKNILTLFSLNNQFLKSQNNQHIKKMMMVVDLQYEKLRRRIHARNSIVKKLSLSVAVGCLQCCSLHLSFPIVFRSTSTVSTPFIFFQCTDYFGMGEMDVFVPYF